MNFTRIDQDHHTLLKIEGELDANTAPELRPVLDALVAEERKHVKVDLSALRLIDSSGVGALVSLYKRVRAAGGEVQISGVRDQPLAIFKLLRLDAVFADAASVAAPN
ncbi:MAG TPA: STAS domain-containing protein [Polyangiaceae bacterium]